MRSLSDVSSSLSLDPEKGLSADQVASSRGRFGANRLTPLPREPIWKKFLEKFDEPIIKILLAAALLSMFVDLFQVDATAAGVALAVVAVAVAAFFALKLGDWIPSLLFASALAMFFVGLGFGHPSVEGLAVMIAVILATGVAFLSEYRSDQEFEKLNSHKDAVQVKVNRDGQFHTVPLDDVVVGDVVDLETGDEVPADGRLFKAVDLSIDQSLMTGEAEPVKKAARPADTDDGPDKPGCLYRGTQVVDGAGVLVITEVGDATMLGQIARRLSGDAGDEDEGGPENEEARVKNKLTISKAQTPLQVKLTNLADLISKVGYAAAVLIFLALLVRGYFFGELFPSTPAAPRVEGEGFVIGKLTAVDKAKGTFSVRTPKGELPQRAEPKELEDAEVGTPVAFVPGAIAEDAVDVGKASQLKVGGPQGWLGVAGNLLQYFVYMVIVIVVAVPEGLPMSVTVSLALAMQKMTRANSLVRQLVACETIGSATVICSDKTGTLTQNKMQVVRLFTGGAGSDRGAAGWALPDTYATVAEGARSIDWIALNAGANSTANLEEKEGKVITVGNSTEGALLHWLREGRVDYVPLRASYPPAYLMHFSSDRKRMTTVVRHGKGLVALMKGAPEIVLDFVTHYAAADGSVRPFDAEARAAVLAYQRDSARQAMRTLAFAHRVLPEDFPTGEEALQEKKAEIEAGLVFDGMVAIRDPLRDDVKDAVERCRAAGIEVKMITGDNVETARAIAYNIGLVPGLDAPIDTPDAVVLTSTKFNEDYARLKVLRTDGAEAEERKAIVDRLTGLRVLARARPMDKYNMVQLLQERDQVVAMTGDGTNDAASLKKADVGLAMGIAGTEVAKEASKIVLLDDAFSTIVKAVQWGRSLYENIQRFIQFQLTINVSALTIAFLGPFLGVKPPFTVLQLLWINVIMDTFASIALCSEPPRDGVMALPPKRKDESIVTPAMTKTILGTAAFFVVVMLGLLLGMRYQGWFAQPFEGVSKESADFGPLTTHQVSIFFAVYVFFQVWNQINCRSLTPETSGLWRLWSNPTFLAIAATTAVVQVLITSVPFLASIFKVEPLGWLEWLCVIGGTSSVLVFAEAWRQVRLRL